MVSYSPFEKSPFAALPVIADLQTPPDSDDCKPDDAQDDADVNRGHQMRLIWFCIHSIVTS